MFENYSVVGQRLPNGKIQLVKSPVDESQKVYENECEFRGHFQKINESVGASNTILILDSING